MGRRRAGARVLLAVLAYGFVAALVALPVAVEQAIESAEFEERIGTFPVAVTLAHNGYSTLDTGLVGKLYWERTGVGGFGASLRSTGPPEAGGTLTSYVAPEFLQANAAFVEEPEQVAAIYGSELKDQVIGSVLRFTLVAGLVGGLLGAAVFRARPPPLPRGRRRRWLVGSAYLVLVLGATVSLATSLFSRWEGNAPVAATYAMPGVPQLSFSSPQTREVAQQIQPFIDKNTERIEERTAAYVDAAAQDLRLEIAASADDLSPREGEVIVLTEADPQGSEVATRARRELYPALEDLLGEDAVAFRTIAGDVTSNGTVAEREFVEREVAAGDGVPVVAVKGDHDSEETVEQMEDADVDVLHQEVSSIGDLKVAGAADPAFKALFGGLVTNPSGITEAEVGEGLREVVDDELENGEAVTVVLHQPRAAAAYLGITSTSSLTDLEGNETTPVDDGIPDVPPGLVTIGHLHDASGPWVIWNTDTDDVTWTVVSQLGTSGGVEENPTFNRFSTPFSVPLKDVSVRLSYVDEDSGLQTGYASVVIDTAGEVTIEERVDVGLPD